MYVRLLKNNIYFIHSLIWVETVAPNNEEIEVNVDIFSDRSVTKMAALINNRLFRKKKKPLIGHNENSYGPSHQVFPLQICLMIHQRATKLPKCSLTSSGYSL